MRFRSIFAFLAGGLAGALAASPAVAGTTLEAVQQRGFLQCGVREGSLGLSLITEAGEWAGFVPDYCRAVAGAAPGPPGAPGPCRSRPSPPRPPRSRAVR